jgi:hypothetical protein
MPRKKSVWHTGETFKNQKKQIIRLLWIAATWVKTYQRMIFVSYPLPTAQILLFLPGNHFIPKNGRSMKMIGRTFSKNK